MLLMERMTCMDHPVMKLRDHPALAEQAASWFHSKWGVPREAYLQSIQLI